MVSLEYQLGQLYEDAFYFHLIHNGNNVIKNQYGWLWGPDCARAKYNFISNDSIKQIVKKS